MTASPPELTPYAEPAEFIPDWQAETNSARHSEAIVAASRWRADHLARLAASLSTTPAAVAVAAVLELVRRFGAPDPALIGVRRGSAVTAVSCVCGANDSFLTRVRQLCDALDLAHGATSTPIAPVRIEIDIDCPANPEGPQRPASVLLGYRLAAGRGDLAGESRKGLADMGAGDLVVRYDTAGYAARSMSSLARRWADMLDQALRTPQIAMADIALADDVAEPAGGGSASASYPPAAAERTIGLVHHEFRDVAGAMPSAIAVIDSAGSLTYAAIDAWADIVATALRAKAVGRGEVVGVLLPRGAAAVAALLGILRHGAIYLPLDPETPLERLSYQTADASACLVLTDGQGPAADLACPSLAMPGQDPQPGRVRDPRGRPADFDRADDPAYIIYTSGSSGRPKGVVLPHRGLAATIAGARLLHRLDPGDRMLHYASPSFDASLYEIFLATTSGATLCAPARTDHLETYLREHEVNIALLAPSVLRTLDPARLPSLRQVIAAGEALSLDLARTWARSAELINAYGPTEMSIATHAATISAQDRSVRIGGPFPGVKTLILGEHDRPVPAGMPGELCTGGPGVALGYLNLPDLTASRFIMNPALPGQLLYRTGDRVREHPDGGLQFLGRIDAQVKLRGYRIECGEIEEQLCRLPWVRAAGVAVTGGEKARLEAHLVFKPGTSGPSEVPAVGVLRDALRGTLPSYMIPAAFCRHEDLPRLPSGKLDRRALAAGCDGQRLAVVPKADDPLNTGRVRDMVEARLAAIWSSLLGLPDFGMRQSFFDLGGDSLLVTTMLSEVERELSCQVRLADFFEEPTLEAMGILVRASRHRSASSEVLVPFTRESARAPFFCVHARNGEVFFLRALRDAGLPAGVIGIRAVGLDGHEPPLRSVPAMAQRYAAEVRQAQPRGPYRIGGFCAGGVIAAETARILHEQGERVEVLALFDADPSIQQGEAAQDEQIIAERLARIRELYGISVLPSQWEAAVATMKEYGAINADMTPELVRTRLEVLAAIVSAVARHKPAPSPVPVTLFLSDALGAQGQAAEAIWRELAPAGFESHYIQTSHLAEDFFRSKALQDWLTDRLARSPS